MLLGEQDLRKFCKFEGASCKVVDMICPLVSDRVNLSLSTTGGGASFAPRFLRPFGIRRRIEVGFPPATTGARASVNTGRLTGKPVAGKEKVIYLTLYQCKALIMYPSFEWQRRGLAWQARLGVQ